MKHVYKIPSTGIAPDIQIEIVELSGNRFAWLFYYDYYNSVHPNFSDPRSGSWDDSDQLSANKIDAMQKALEFIKVKGY